VADTPSCASGLFFVALGGSLGLDEADANVHLSAAMNRPLRKDAAERRGALLSAARAVFAEEGIDAPLDHIAVRAGVGRATLYRNYPGRREIAEAALTEDLAELEERFKAASEPDAFLDFLSDLSARLERNAALGGIVAAARSQETVEALRAMIVRAAARPLAASLAAGMVRKDLALEDIRVLVAMLAAGLANAAPGERPKLARRALQFVLDAVRLQT
jgi:AcrR family transcriptional regulator